MSVNRSLNLRPGVIDIANIVDGIQTISVTGGNVNANSYLDIPVTFPKRYAQVPLTLVSFRTSSTAGGFGRCSVGTVNNTTTGCTIRVFNGDTSTRAPAVVLLAIGTLA